MNRQIIIALGAMSFLSIAPSVLAQDAPPSYQGDPSVYKVIFEDQNFRVISIERKKGTTDKPHSHPVPGVIYSVTECSTRIRDANGQTRDSVTKAGTAIATPVVASHTAENFGSGDCQQVIVERK
jgi:hypothetical protein